ncbi:toxoplasma gondii family A protein [Toxoplasma gondii TgCatPRC2]|uniref:Toxoplasma gondii family A protein n=1 Tax=Toxoplasma gondii TgCatPRC2 TaxID=1130821 RepID=A0A151HS33_TOXGO|nr:toxoplasma gondii family A protein [Toxoplasma gondii TgCatPRC2]
MRSRMGAAISQKLWRRDAFPGYSRPLWMRSSAHVGRGEEVPAGTVANYTLSNLPADSMSEGLSLCVRFMTSAAATTSTTAKSPTAAVDSTTMPSESTEGSSTGPAASSGSTSLSGGGSDSSTDPSRPPQPSPELQPPKQAQLAPQQQPPEAPQKPAPSKSPASSRPKEKLPPTLPDDGLKGDEGEDPGEAGEEGVQGEFTHGGASQDETDALEKQEELHPVPADNAINEPRSSIVGSPQNHTTPNINTEAAEQGNSTAASVEKEHQPLQPLDEAAVQAKPVENPGQDNASDDAPSLEAAFRRRDFYGDTPDDRCALRRLGFFTHDTVVISCCIVGSNDTSVQHLILGRNVGTLGTFSGDAQFLVQTLSHPVGRSQRQFVYSSRIRCDPLRPVSKILRRNTRSTCVTWSRRTHYMYQPSTFLGDSANSLPAD